MPGSAGLLGSAPTPGRAASSFVASGSGRLWESREKAAQSQTFALQEAPQSGTRKATRKSLPGVGSVHPVSVIPAGPSKKGSCKDINPCLFEGSGDFHWHFTLLPLLGT